MTAPAEGLVTRYRPALTAVALFALAVVVNGQQLQTSPVYFYHDEVMFALNGHSIATTGHDLNGLRFPLFIQTFAFVPPIAIYMRVILFLFLPVSVLVARIPGVIVAAADVALLYLVGRRLFRREDLAILSAIFVLLTPKHFLDARLGGDHAFAVPFVIAFLLFTIDFVERRNLTVLGAATACLGFGIYGYNGAMTSMPVFLALTWVVLFTVLGIRTVRPYLVAVGGFLLSLLPMIPWLIVHPEQITHQLRSYNVGGGGTAPAPAIGAMFAPIVARLDAYWGFFDPSLLFFKGDGSLLDSTREVGVFLLPFLVLLPVGAYYMLRHQRTAADHLILLSFLAAPVGALVVDEVKMTRALVIVPIAALIAARGVEALFRMRQLAWRALGVVLLGLMLVQFQQFYRDYFGGYRERSAEAFEGNREGALTALVARAEQNRSQTLYISRNIPLMDYSWRFWVVEHGRQDWRRRATFFDESFDVASAPSGSVFLSSFNGSESPLDGSPALKRVALIADANGHSSFAIHER